MQSYVNICFIIEVIGLFALKLHYKVFISIVILINPTFYLIHFTSSINKTKILLTISKDLTKPFSITNYK